MSHLDFTLWKEFLENAMERALDFGVEAHTVLNVVATTVSQNHTPTSGESSRIADVLLSHLEMGEARSVPVGVLDFANDTLIATYPPAPRNKDMSVWLIQSLTRVVDACPSELLLDVVEMMKEGIIPWISDEYQVFSDEVYTHDVSYLGDAATFGLLT